MKRSLIAIAGAICAAILSPVDGGASEESLISLELNRLSSTGDRCVATFVAHNRLGSDLEKLGFEIVLFDCDGLVDRLTKFNFGALADGKTIVRQFEISGILCEDISQILINGASTCTGANLDPTACDKRLKVSNKTSIQFGQ